MRSTKTGRRTAALALAAGASLLLAACGGGGGGGTAAAGGKAPGLNKAACAPIKPIMTQFGDLSGKSVKIYTSIVAPEDTSQKNSYKLFESCTGAKVVYEGSKEFEAQLVVRVRSGNPPDLAIIPQPGLLGTLVRDTGKVKPAPASVAKNVDKWWGPDWKQYGTVDGKFYAAPLGANVKSFVWYSPTNFQKWGVTVPTTWDEMLAVSDKIAAAGVKPWCAGIGSGDATGWPMTDWLEDVILRDYGATFYDQWVANKVKFTDPKVIAAFDRVGGILKNPKYVNGGIGDVKSIATTTFQDGGLPVASGKCGMHRQASFYANFWPEGTKVAENGDVFAFYLPVTNQNNGKPVLGGGEFIAAFADRPEVQAFQTYLSTDTWANEKAKATPSGGWVSANKGLDVNNLVSPIDKLAGQIFQDPQATFRFDGSDQMPAAVGAGSFWKEATAWIATDKSTQDVASAVQESWPSS